MKTPVDRRPAPFWECDDGLVHVVDPTSDAGVCNWFTECGLHVKAYPGVWRADAIGATCSHCCDGVYAAHITPSVPFWVFRTTGGVTHGVFASTNTPLHQLVTYCGTSTQAKIDKNTGRWEHKQPPLTCIGCLAAKDVTK